MNLRKENAAVSVETHISQKLTKLSHFNRGPLPVVRMSSGHYPSSEQIEFGYFVRFLFIITLLFCVSIFAGCSPSSTSNDNRKPDSSFKRVSRERVLPGGKHCRAVLVGNLDSKGRYPSLSNLEVSIDERIVNVPPESFFDLHDISERQSVDFSEFAGETFLLVTGGESSTTWQAKLTIHDNYISVRELTTFGGASSELRFSPPAVLHYGTIPPSELTKALTNTSTPSTKR